MENINLLAFFQLEVPKLIPVCFSSLSKWTSKRWIIALVTSVITYIIIAIPTAIIKNPIFGREVGVTSWSIPVLVITSILSGYYLQLMLEMKTIYLKSDQPRSDL
jgi:hypothetical protein